jgi:hypothetical protein
LASWRLGVEEFEVKAVTGDVEVYICSLRGIPDQWAPWSKAHNHKTLFDAGLLFRASWPEMPVDPHRQGVIIGSTGRARAGWQPGSYSNASRYNHDFNEFCSFCLAEGGGLRLFYSGTISRPLKINVLLLIC